MVSANVLLRALANVLLAAAWASSPTTDVIRTSTGMVVGGLLPSNNNSQAFFEIPFGQPPTGTLRLQPPLPAEPWDDVKNCTTNTNQVCMQANPTPWEKTVVGSEDYQKTACDTSFHELLTLMPHALAALAHWSHSARPMDIPISVITPLSYSCPPTASPHPTSPSPRVLCSPYLPAWSLGGRRLCRSLNAFTPSYAIPHQTDLPVFLWLYGNGSTAGYA